MASFLGSLNSLPSIIKFSIPVRFSSTEAFCPDKPIISRACSGSLITSTSETMAVPESGTNKVVKTRTAVVLPAPFGPSNPKTLPCSTFKLSPSRAVTSPYFFTKLVASIAIGKILLNSLSAFLLY